MANFNLTWVPASNGSSLSQNIQYKKSIDSSWLLNSNVSPVTNVAVLSGLLDNTIYDFRIENVCNFGGPTPSSLSSSIGFNCPVNTLTETTTTIAYSFTHPGGSVSAITVELLNSSSVVVQTQNLSIGTPVTGTFSGLTANTGYKVRITLVAGTFNNVCPAQDITTDPLVCEAPTGLTATIV